MLADINLEKLNKNEQAKMKKARAHLFNIRNAMNVFHPTLPMVAKASDFNE